MASLQDAIAYVQTLVGGISGIRAYPEYPPDSINIFPFAVAFAGGGTWEIVIPGVKKGLHTIVLELHVARKDLPRDVEKAMAYSDSIPNELLNDTTLGGNASTFGSIRYTFGPLGYGTTETIGFRFYIENVKIETTIT